MRTGPNGCTMVARKIVRVDKRLDESGRGGGGTFHGRWLTPLSTGW